MKKPLIPALLVALLALANLFAACDTTTNYTTEPSRSCILTDVTLGTLNRTVKAKTSAGKDTTFTTTVTGTSYPLYIDQVNNRIYNADSLPMGTDVKHVVFSSVTSSGYAIIKQLTTQKDTTWAAADSTDFSQPRTVSAIAYDGQSRKDYTMELRVHNEEADTFSWQTPAQGTASAIAALTQLHAVADGRLLYIYGVPTAGGAPQVVATGTAAPQFTSAQAADTPAGKTLDTRSVRLFKGTFYALATDGTLLRASAGNGQWQSQTTSPAAFTALAGSSTDSLFALSGGQIYASADGLTWQQSPNDAGESLPTVNVGLTCLPSRTDETYESVVLMGQQADGAMSVWKRDIDRKGDFSYAWYSLPQSTDLGSYAAPKLASPTLVSYDNAGLLVGLAADSVSPFYLSRDFGRTWIPGSLKHPAMKGVTSVAATVDADHYIWIFCAGSASVYKGRINRLGWATEPTAFEKARRR